MLQCVEFGHISMDGEKLPDESSDVNRLLTCMHDMKYTCFKFKNYPLIPALTDCIWIVKFKTCYFPEVLKRNTGFFNCKRAFYFIKNSNYKNKGSPTVLCFDLYRSSSGNCRWCDMCTEIGLHHQKPDFGHNSYTKLKQITNLWKHPANRQHNCAHKSHYRQLSGKSNKQRWKNWIDFLNFLENVAH